MAQRLLLHQRLLQLTPNVYFQPPENVEMKYPAIVYSRDYADTKFANNAPYQHVKRYQVTVIDANADSELPEKVAQMPMCLFSRHFATAGLNHDIYDLYF